MHTPLPNIVASELDALRRICAARRVHSLHLFGSAATGERTPGVSDLDFLVVFETMPPIEHKNAYFGLLDDLRTLFGERIDLAEPTGVRNPYVRESIEKSKVSVYAAA